MSIIAPGFNQNVEQSQVCFRQLLTALSEPGTEVTLDQHVGFSPLNSAASQVILCLCDQLTPLYLSPFLAELVPGSDIAQAQRNFTFHCNTKPSSLVNADFAVISSQESIHFSRLKVGTDEQPHQSVTLIIQTDDFTSGPKLTLSGPGIPNQRTVQLGQLHPKILQYLLAPSHPFPLGVDLLFCHQQSLIAISRTTKVELASCM